jgi:hypothetical protein
MSRLKNNWRNSKRNWRMTKSVIVSILNTVKIAKMIIVLKSALAGQLYDILVDEGTLVTQTPLVIIGRQIHSY